MCGRSSGLPLGGRLFVGYVRYHGRTGWMDGWGALPHTDSQHQASCFVFRIPARQLALLSTFSVPFRLDLASSLFGSSNCVFVSCFPTGRGEQCENNGALLGCCKIQVPEDTRHARHGSSLAGAVPDALCRNAGPYPHPSLPLQGQAGRYRPA